MHVASSLGRAGGITLALPCWRSSISSNRMITIAIAGRIEKLQCLGGYDIHWRKQQTAIIVPNSKTGKN